MFGANLVRASWQGAGLRFYTASVNTRVAKRADLSYGLVDTGDFHDLEPRQVRMIARERRRCKTKGTFVTPPSVGGLFHKAARAVRLFGAAAAMRAAGAATSALHVTESHALNTARAQLNKEAWDVAWAEGRAMTLEQAIAYALEDAPDA